MSGTLIATSAPLSRAPACVYSADLVLLRDYGTIFFSYLRNILMTLSSLN